MKMGCIIHCKTLLVQNVMLPNHQINLAFINNSHKNLTCSIQFPKFVVKFCPLQFIEHQVKSRQSGTVKRENKFLKIWKNAQFVLALTVCLFVNLHAGIVQFLVMSRRRLRNAKTPYRKWSRKGKKIIILQSGKMEITNNISFTFFSNSSRIEKLISS